MSVVVRGAVSNIEPFWCMHDEPWLLKLYDLACFGPCVERCPCLLWCLQKVRGRIAQQGV